LEITPITRRDIADAVAAESVNWSGRLGESAFLSRIYELERLPSTDRRHPNAAGDISQHREMNLDWEDDWIFYDERFGLMSCPDEQFLRFLRETLHPAVQPNAAEIERICGVYNERLRNDGFELVEEARLSGRPVYVARRVGVAGTPGLTAAREALSSVDSGYVAGQIRRMEAAIPSDPGLAIGTAKELVETVCKTILERRGAQIPKSADIGELVKLTAKQLELTPSDIPDGARAAETIRRLLSNFGSITQGLTELRNQYGTGHGRAAGSKSLQPRHARLAVGAASTLAVFMIETHEAREA
jgi:hypothetical protein